MFFNRRRRPATPRPTARLSVEPLDDRIVPARLSVGDAVIVEGSPDTTSVAEVRVTLGAPSNKTVSVSYRSADGTAKAGSDYYAVSGKLTFAPGETSKTVAVFALGDTRSEGRETYFINLSGAKNARIADGRGVVSILDDRPAVRVSDAQAYPGTTTLAFTVSLSAAHHQAVTVSYSTADATAVAGEDYAAASGTLTFAPGETTKSFTVDLLGDTTVGSAQEFLVNLRVTYADGVVADTWGFGIIWNADGYPDPYGYGYSDQYGYGYGGGYY